MQGFNFRIFHYDLRDKLVCRVILLEPGGGSGGQRGQVRPIVAVTADLWKSLLGGVLIGAGAATLLSTALLSTTLLSASGHWNAALALTMGSAIFGIGWGLSGICPGPGLLLLTGASIQSVVFVVSVITGFIALRLLNGSPAPDRSDNEADIQTGIAFDLTAQRSGNASQLRSRGNRAGAGGSGGARSRAAASVT